MNASRYSCKNPLKLYDTTEYLTFIGQTSIYTQQCFPSYQVQLRAQIDTSLCNVLRWDSSSSCHPLVHLWNLNTLHFMKLNFDVIIGIHNNNFFWKILNLDIFVYNSPMWNIINTDPFFGHYTRTDGRTDGKRDSKRRPSASKGTQISTSHGLIQLVSELIK
jgi:hypothetical protein